jgi:hypothetical protein
MRVTTAAVVLALLLTSAACADNQRSRDDVRSGGTKGPVTRASHPPNVVHLQGIGPVRYGDTRKELLDRKAIAEGAPGCDGKPVYDVPGYVDAADLVFNEQDKLAFVWVFTEGVHTPENLTVGSPIGAVRTAHPDAEELKANAQSFPAVLVKSGRTAYLFLYEASDGKVVKLLAGYTDILREAQNAGITC